MRFLGFRVRSFCGRDCLPWCYLSPVGKVWGSRILKILRVGNCLVGVSPTYCSPSFIHPGDNGLRLSASAGCVGRCFSSRRSFLRRRLDVVCGSKRYAGTPKVSLNGNRAEKRGTVSTQGNPLWLPSRAAQCPGPPHRIQVEDHPLSDGPMSFK